MPHSRCLLFVVLCAFAALSATARTAWAQGACCQPQGCVDVPNNASCSGFGGVYLEGASCAEQPCGPGACCTGLACLNGFSAYDCISGGRDYAGGGTICAEDPCEIGVGACCNNGGCSVLSEPDCSGGGGLYLGPGSQCLNTPCAEGVCCLPGECEPALNFQCTDGGGTFVAGADCDMAEPCEVLEDCPGDALAAQSLPLPNQLGGLISDDDAGFKRLDRFSGVPGRIDAVRWFAFDVRFTGGGFEECEDTANLFLVELREDVGNAPGKVVCSYDFIEAEVTPTSILLGDFRLNEYRLQLDSPCLLTHGWLSIQGLGDDCWMAWTNAAAGQGDGFSICEGCDEPIENVDLAWCLLGEFGGVSGACCDEADGLCDDPVDISSCTGDDQRFTESQTCDGLSQPCEPVTGACCLTDGTCEALGETACGDLAGDWQGQDGSCDGCPVLGACCIDGTNCVLTTAAGCFEENLTYAGDNTTCDDCPEPPTCPPDGLFEQIVDVPPSFFAGTSEDSSPFRRWDDFTEVAGPIEGLTWWGVDLQPQGNGFIECVEPMNEFSITFHEDAGGSPGTEVCSYILEVDAVEQGLLYGGSPLNTYSVTLPEPCVLPNGWVSLSGRGSTLCWFLWMSADSPGTSWCGGCPNQLVGSDMSLCIAGQPGVTTGACCNTNDSSCADDVAIEDCLGADQQFSARSNCAELDPPCGVLEGACCLPNDTCSTAVEDNCNTAGGLWLGANSVCSMCPCANFCPAGGVAEGEPECFDGYVDTFNPGCESKTPAFSNIEICQTVCGTSGVTAQGQDFDWYAVQVDEPTTLRWEVDAEFDVVSGIVDGNQGCAGLEVLDSALSEPCEQSTLLVTVDAGTHWLVVQPAGNGDVLCGAGYTATLTADEPCDVTCETVADCADLNDDNIRDDGCVWWACQEGTCVPTDVPYGDVGGSDGSCPPDGSADGNDRFHALSCFANIDTLGKFESYPCEDLPPRAMNVDSAGPWGSCTPDGICDANDAYASLNAFEGLTPCTCPEGGPAPQAAVRTVDAAAFRLQPQRSKVRGGQLVFIDVSVDGPLDDLRGYQLHVSATGGHSGRLELVDMAVAPRPNTALPEAQRWTAFNLNTRQLAAGIDGPGHPIAAGSYLATLTFRASSDATGRFTVELLHDPQDPTHRTQLLPTVPLTRIDIPGRSSVAIDVHAHPHMDFQAEVPADRRTERIATPRRGIGHRR